MQVELLHSTPLWVASTAIRKCWASEDKSDSTDNCVACHSVTKEGFCDYCEVGYDLLETFKVTGDKDKELIHRIGNKNKHSSTLEHLTYSFDIDGISRACLQELARHRMASYSVKSTRYTLKELRGQEYAVVSGKAQKYLVYTGDVTINNMSDKALEGLRMSLRSGVSNDQAKYCLPEAYKTSLVMTINARSLQNFLELRTSPHALWEIRKLAYEIYKKLPDDHKYLFEEYLYQQEGD